MDDDLEAIIENHYSDTAEYATTHALLKICQELREIKATLKGVKGYGLLVQR